LIGLDSSLKLIAECNDAEDASNYVLSHPIDLLIISVELPGMSGIEFARNLDQRGPMIIFISSSGSQALEAFNLGAVDFLLKPIQSLRFMQAIHKGRGVFSNKNIKAIKREDGFVFIRELNVIKRVKVGDILFMEAKGDYVKIHLTNHIYSIHSSLKSVEEKLSSRFFLKVHRSFIVNVSKIDALEGNMLVIHKLLVPVSDAHRAALLNRLLIL